MFKHKIFNTMINLRSECCKKDNCNALKIKEPYVNIYVRLQNNCNATCKFCEFRGNKIEFDFDKFFKVLKEIKKRLKINKVSFTGGEPTLDLGLLYDAIAAVKFLNNDTFVVVNTNGINLNKLLNLNINSISMSRHHYNDEKNNEILGFKATSKKIINTFENKEVLHLSCNLIKGYIDSEDEIIKYLEFSNEVGVNDVGFVSLMTVNDYCKSHFKDFKDFNFSRYKNMLKSTTWEYKDCCRCANYLYASEIDANIIRMYSRYYVKPHDVESQLVFDGQYLRNGFNGKIIY